MSERPDTTVEGERKRREVLDGAAKLFATHGFDNTSINDVARMANLKKASLYHYLEKKEDLLYEICLESIRRTESEVATAIQNQPAGSQLRGAIRAHIITAVGDQSLHAVMLMEMPMNSANDTKPRRCGPNSPNNASASPAPSTNGKMMLK